jgi:hypothetical protein
MNRKKRNIKDMDKPRIINKEEQKKNFDKCVDMYNCFKHKRVISNITVSMTDYRTNYKGYGPISCGHDFGDFVNIITFYNGTKIVTCNIDRDIRRENCIINGKCCTKYMDEDYELKCLEDAIKSYKNF